MSHASLHHNHAQNEVHGQLCRGGSRGGGGGGGGGGAPGARAPPFRSSNYIFMFT